MPALLNMLRVPAGLDSFRTRHDSTGLDATSAAGETVSNQHFSMYIGAGEQLH